MTYDRSSIVDPAHATPPSNVLFSAIVATVAASGGQRITVRDVAERLGTAPAVAARCIAIHTYFRRNTADRLLAGTMELPPPADLAIPADDEVLDEARLGLGQNAAI